MKIPRIPVPGINSGKAWCDSGNGKGSDPRNMGEKFLENHSRIFDPKKRAKPGHTRIVWRGGKKLTYLNGELQPS